MSEIISEAAKSTNNVVTTLCPIPSSPVVIEGFQLNLTTHANFPQIPQCPKSSWLDDPDLPPSRGLCSQISSFTRRREDPAPWRSCGLFVLKLQATVARPDSVWVDWKSQISPLLNQPAHAQNFRSSETACQVFSRREATSLAIGLRTASTSVPQRACVIAGLDNYTHRSRKLCIEKGVLKQHKINHIRLTSLFT